MATREENLKIINEKLEKLSDEQLEQVAGGTADQVRRDAFFLSALLKGSKDAPKSPTIKTFLGVFADCGGVREKDVTKAWDILGIDYSAHWVGSNDYVVKETGKKLTQAQAWTFASKAMGRE